MEAVLNKGHNHPNLNLPLIQRSQGKPNNGNDHRNNNLGKEGIGQTGQLEKPIGIGLVTVIFLGKAVLLKLFASKGPNHAQTGQVFPGKMVDPVQTFLLFLR